MESAVSAALAEKEQPSGERRAEVLAAIRVGLGEARAEVERVLIAHGTGAPAAPRPGFAPDPHGALEQPVEEPLPPPEDRDEPIYINRGGREAAESLAAVTDAALRSLHRAACGLAGAAEGNGPGGSCSEGAEEPPLALVAVGGYGRGRMAPGSDVDVLFLMPEGADARASAVAEWVLYALWDLKLKVGNSTRSCTECVALAREDATIRTALLEARHVCGDPALTGRMAAGVRADLTNGEASAFVEAKLAERDARHQREGDTRYHVEPNVKEGKGGQRDLQTLFWIAKAIHGVTRGREFVELGVFEPDEHALFVAAEDFQWAVRCHMHFIRGGRAEEVLSFDLQPEVAERMGYRDDPGDGMVRGGGRSAVERFMRAYFRTAKAVGDLTRVLCADLEERHAKAPLTGVGAVIRRLAGTLRRRKLPGTSDFVSQNGRIVLADEAGFSSDPVNLIRLFHLADLHGLELHPDTLKRVTRRLDLIDDALRADAEANRLFLAILTSPRDPEEALKRMSEAGVLGRFVPAFGRITAMMQFSMYHRYTVDQHLIRTVGVYKEIADGDEKGLHPLSVKLIPLLEDRAILPVACFLHDIAKGRPEDHSVAGAREARELCPRFGLSPAQTDAVAWLIEEHLTMSMTSQTRDLSDRRTIADFTARVQSLERLRMLMILTVCDIRAVGPGVWNGWKGQLLRTLYREAELVLTGGHGDRKTGGAQSGKDRARAAREALVKALIEAGWRGRDATAHAALHYPPYLLSTPLETQVDLAGFVRRSEAEGGGFATELRTDEFEGTTRIFAVSPDHPRLLALLTGACSAGGANIVDAQVSTMTDGRALDVITLTRAFEREEDELRRAERITGFMRAMLKGERLVDELIEERAPAETARARAFDVAPRVEVSNALSDRFTVIEIEGGDRPGLLSEIASDLAALNLDIASAHVTTFGEKVIDAFYVTDLMGGKITGEMRRWRIREQLLATVRGEEAGDLRTGQSADDLARRGA